MRFRTAMVLDDMGNSAAGRSTGATIGVGASNSLGSTGGSAAETLGESQIPAHADGGSTLFAGGHSHTGTANNAGTHQHTYGEFTDSGNEIVQAGTGSGVQSPGGNVSTATGAAGDHGHSLAIDPVSAHQHSFN